MDSQTFSNVGWTVGNYCNATCGHCYSWQIRKDSQASLVDSDIDRVVDQLKSMNVKTVNLGGNEPIYTNGSDIKETRLPYIIRKLTEANIPVGLTTNGTSFAYLDRNYRKELIMLNDIDFSLDSPFEEEHDRSRGARLFRVTIKSIRRSVELGIKCSITICAMHWNFSQKYLSAFLTLTKLLGCEFRVNTLRPVDPALLQQMPTAEQFFDGFSYLMQNTDCLTLGDSCLSTLTHSGAVGCPCGTTSFRINGKTADGKITVTPCVYIHGYRAGDLLKQDLADIVSGPEFTAFASRRDQLPQDCIKADCNLREQCRGGCASRSLLVYGGLDYKDPYCPKDYIDQHGYPKLPDHILIGFHDGIRVHENYLCTWIGKVKEGFHHDQYRMLEQYFQGASREQRLPGPVSAKSSEV